MTKRGFRVLFLVLFVLILGFQFKINYDLETQPPSKEWSKEFLLSKGNVKAYPKVIKVKDNYIIAHDDGDKVKVMIVDSMGKKLNEAVLNANDVMVRDLNLLYDGKNLYVNWIITKNSNKILNKVVLDSNLKEMKREQSEGVDQAVQVDENILLMQTGSKIEFLNLAENKSYTINNTGILGYLAGTKTKEGYLVSFMDKEQTFKFFTVKNGIISDIKQAGTMHKNNFDSFDKIAVAVDNDKGYILVEVRAKGAFGTVKCITFNLDGSSYNISDLKVGLTRYLYNPISVSSKDEARFIACSERKFGKKDERYDVVDFSIKDGKIVKNNFLSRTKDTTLFPGASDGVAVFCDYNDEETYDIYMASQDKKFMDMVNGVKKFEIKNALGQTFNGLINSILYILIIGSKWILFGALLATIFTFMAYSINEKRKKMFYIIVYGLTLTLKLYIVYDIFYKQYAGILPGSLASAAVGVIITLALSLITMVYGYNEYKGELEAMPIISYIKAIVIDTLLTLMIFVPFLA